MERGFKHEGEGTNRTVRMRIDRLRQRGKMAADRDMYSILGLSSRHATDTEVRRAFRNLITKEHPDKGGDPERFKEIKLASDVLSNKAKREHYDATGKVTKTAGEDFMDSFRGGTFGFQAAKSLQKENVADQITVIQKNEQSHSAGFEAWMRSRGPQGTAVFTAESMAEQFGVNKDTYDAFELPRIEAYVAKCQAAGRATEVIKVESEAIPLQLEWGMVLVKMDRAPIDPADIYTSTMGGTYGSSHDNPPYIAGHQGLGVVMKVGMGVKDLCEDDWVIPLKSHLGTWRTLAVLKAADLHKVPSDIMPVEYASLSQQLCLAYRLLEDFGQLKHGDCVILNAATSTVGQVLIQLCFTLQLRTVAVVRDHGSFEKVQLWLKSLGVSQVVADAGSIRGELDKLRFFAKPKLGLDAVGGSSGLRLADALAEGGQHVIYGCLSGKAPAWPWQAWVFKGLQVHGFNLRQWMAKNTAKINKMLEALGKLIRSEQLQIAFTEYELSTELEEALGHAMDAGTNTKVLLRMSDLGTTY